MTEERPDLPDYLCPGLKLVFVGFNPGDRSSQVGHYYAWPGNQFWNFLFESRLVPEKLAPYQDHRLLEFGIGLTDVVKRWSRSSSGLRTSDYQEGIPRLITKLRDAKPQLVAFNGKTAYEKVCGRRVRLGLQNEMLEGARVFVLPSTSGRNGSLTRRAKLAYFRRLARLVATECWIEGAAPERAVARLSAARYRAASSRLRASSSWTMRGPYES